MITTNWYEGNGLLYPYFSNIYSKYSQKKMDIKKDKYGIYYPFLLDFDDIVFKEINSKILKIREGMIAHIFHKGEYYKNGEKFEYDEDIIYKGKIFLKHNNFYIKDKNRMLSIYPNNMRVVKILFDLKQYKE